MLKVGPTVDKSMSLVYVQEDIMKCCLECPYFLQNVMKCSFWLPFQLRSTAWATCIINFFSPACHTQGATFLHDQKRSNLEFIIRMSNKGHLVPLVG